MTRFPANFVFCVGAQKAGTTWLADQLHQHPQVSLPPRKELDYFTRIYGKMPPAANSSEQLSKHIRRLQNIASGKLTPNAEEYAALRWNAQYLLVDEPDDNWYMSLFAEAGNNKLTGDFSPNYSRLPQQAFAHMQRCVPHAKVLFVLRNPVDRTWSGALYARRRQLKETERLIPKNIRGAFFGETQREFSDYPKIMDKLESVFGQKNVVYTFYDDLRNDPLGYLRDVCGLFALDFDEAMFPRASERVNAGPPAERDEELLRELSVAYMPMLERLADRFQGHAASWLDVAKATAASAQ